MKPSLIFASGLFFGLTAGAALLVTLPRTMLPCEVTVTYSGKSIKPTGIKSRFLIIDITKQKTLRGRGNFGPRSLTCEVDLMRTEGV